MTLKNRYLAIIYKGCLDGETAKRIHKRLYDETVRSKPQYADKFLLAMMIKETNRAKKLPQTEGGLLAAALFDLFQSGKIRDKAKKLINYDTQRQAEERKQETIDDFVEGNRAEGRWFYLASSHNDCAEDHKPYQGRMYVDEKAPDSAIQFAKSRGWLTVQWVMGAPAWFITRPNCRHYFVGVTESEVRGKPLKRLKRKYGTHTKEGNREFQTPAHAAVEEYEDRLRMLRGLYREYPTDKLKAEILKTELLVRKWKEMDEK